MLDQEELQRQNVLINAARRRMSNEEIQREIMRKIAERRQLLSSKLPAPTGKVGGLMGQAVHLGQYQWEGLAGAMLFEWFQFMLSVIFNLNFLQDQAIYDQLDDDCKFNLDNYDPQVNPLYGFSYDANGELKMDLSRPLRRDEITDTVLIANGYMPKPDANLGLRKSWGQYCEKMLGSTCDPELDAVFNAVRGMNQQPRPTPENANDLDDYQRMAQQIRPR